jgi:hypothetical protein
MAEDEVESMDVIVHLYLFHLHHDSIVGHTSDSFRAVLQVFPIFVEFSVPVIMHKKIIPVARSPKFQHV